MIMPNHNQDGEVNVIFLVVTVLLLIAAIIFGAWAYSGKQDYKNNVQAKITTAVTAAQQQQATTLNAKFAQQEQSPYLTYNGPEAYGSIVLTYPRTWSGYVDTSGGTYPVDSYFNPGIVPSITDQDSVFALEVRVLNQSYSQTLTGITQTGVVSQAYSLPNLPKVVGVEVNGEVSGSQTNETMVILPLRADTLEIWTDGTQYLDDFNNVILKNFSFSP
jgi:hypothetical protein